MGSVGVAGTGAATEKMVERGGVGARKKRPPKPLIFSTPRMSSAVENQPRINAEMMPKYEGRRVILLGEVGEVAGGAGTMTLTTAVRRPSLSPRATRALHRSAPAPRPKDGTLPVLTSPVAATPPAQDKVLVTVHLPPGQAVAFAPR